MSKFKGRNGTPEVHSARSKLDGVLQTLVTKKEESPPDNRDTEESEDAMLSTPTKRSGQQKVNRKRKRGKEEPNVIQDIAQFRNTYVMKLFDRSVDLAQFDDNSPLYPICRAWMKNHPTIQKPLESPIHESEPHVSFDDEDDIYNLPSPILVKSEIGHYIDRRIPSPEPQPEGPLDILADPETAPAPEQILYNHMVRWKQIRQRWKDAGRRREGQYAASLEIIRNMYDRQCKE